jgi:hypothetical protein
MCIYMHVFICKGICIYVLIYHILTYLYVFFFIVSLAVEGRGHGAGTDKKYPYSTFDMAGETGAGGTNATPLGEYIFFDKN